MLQPFFSRFVRTIALWPLIFVGHALAQNQAYVRLVPVEPQGLTAPPYPASVEIIGDTIFVANPPQRVWLEMRVGGWGTVTVTPGEPCRLRVAQACMDAATLSNGLGADLLPAVVTCNSDDTICENELGPEYNSGGGCLQANDTQCSPVLVNPLRRDLFLELHACAASPSALTCGIKGFHGNKPPDDGGDHYLGTVVLDIPADAYGTYALQFISDAPGCYFGCQDNGSEEFSELLPATIRICDADECGQKNRYFTVAPNTLPPSLSESAALRVRTLEFNGAAQSDPPVRWIGQPQSYPEPAGGGSFFAAPLECFPFVFDWSTLPPAAQVHVYGQNVVPSSRYEVRAGSADCVFGPNSDACLTAPEFHGTANYGDVVAEFGTAMQPNFADISAVVHAFRLLPSAVSKPRAQLAGESADPAAPVSFLDIAAAVDAFRGAPFPFLSIGSCP